MDSNFRARRHYGVMEYMIWIKKTSEILRNPTSSKWSENFWSCLQVDSLGFEQRAECCVLCRRSGHPYNIFLFIYIYIYIYSSTCVKQSPCVKRSFRFVDAPYGVTYLWWPFKTVSRQWNINFGDFMKGDRVCLMEVTIW